MASSPTSPKPRPPWLPRILDDAFEGYASRPHETEVSEVEHKPVLWWTKAAGLMRRKGGMPRVDISTMLQDPRALWIMPVNKARYWWLHRERGMQVWESMQPACIGVAVVDDMFIPVYRRKAVIDILVGNFVDATSVNASEIRANQLKFLTEEIEPVWMGKPTPYFIS